MDNIENEFSAEESLKVIRSMIESTKASISDHSHYFLLWGYATVIGCLLDFILLYVVNSPYHYYAWLITILTFIPHFILLRRDKKHRKVSTFINEAIYYVWVIIGISFWVLNVAFIKIGWEYSFTFFILLYGIGTFISGSLMKFKPMRTGGIICMFLVALAPYLSFPFQVLLGAVAILISYIIPGHLLRNQYKANIASYGK